MGVVRWLLDEGAAVNKANEHGDTALILACWNAHLAVVRLLLERGADPTIANREGWTPLMIASWKPHLEVVRLLLCHPKGKVTPNHRDDTGGTGSWHACYWGHGMVARALLQSGADPTIANNDGITPMATATQPPDHGGRISVEGRRECVAALEVRLYLFICSRHIAQHLLF
jgi:ankyrin repeat protein